MKNLRMAHIGKSAFKKTDKSRAPLGLVQIKGTCRCGNGSRGRRPVPRAGVCTKCRKARR